MHSIADVIGELRDVAWPVEMNGYDVETSASKTSEARIMRFQFPGMFVGWRRGRKIGSPQAIG
ncbi:hypothetical protein BGC_00630 [Burkholderia sp. 3C]